MTRAGRVTEVAFFDEQTSYHLNRLLASQLLVLIVSPCFPRFILTGSILIKTNRVSRIFNEKLLRTGTIRCVGNYWQLLILGCLLTTEIVLLIVWVFGSSSHVIPEVIYSESSKDASLVCNLTGSQIGFSLWLIYNAGLVVVCTYQAFLVRKVPHNYNESRLIAFNMTTLCITVLVYIPSYMGTTAWYRTIISSFMSLFLGTLTWTCLFAPKIYIILFRPHKNVPMRPSVSSITLGVITPSPTVASSLSEQAMRSRQSSSSANEEESWEGLRRYFDSSRDLNENEAADNLKNSRELCSACFAEFDKVSKYSENEESSQINIEIENAEAIKLDSQQNTEASSQKKTSVVHYEDVFDTEYVENKDKLVTPRKKSSCSQGGILRKTHTSENPENLNGVSVRKKKISLVRFQDEVANQNGPECNRVALPAKSEEISKLFNNEDSRNKRALNGYCVSNDEKPNIGKSVAQQGRKRKISVFTFE